MIMGEISTSCYVDIPSIARNVVLEIGYDRAKYGFDGTTCSVLTSIDEQSKDIALGVDHSLETKEGGEENNGAGDPVSYTHLPKKYKHIASLYENRLFRM